MFSSFVQGRVGVGSRRGSPPGGLRWRAARRRRGRHPRCARNRPRAGTSPAPPMRCPHGAGGPRDLREGRPCPRSTAGREQPCPPLADGPPGPLSPAAAVWRVSVCGRRHGRACALCWLRLAARFAMVCRCPARGGGSDTGGCPHLDLGTGDVVPTGSEGRRRSAGSTVRWKPYRCKEKPGT